MEEKYADVLQLIAENKDNSEYVDYQLSYPIDDNVMDDLKKMLEPQGYQVYWNYKSSIFGIGPTDIRIRWRGSELKNMLC